MELTVALNSRFQLEFFKSFYVINAEGSCGSTVIPRKISTLVYRYEGPSSVWW